MPAPLTESRFDGFVRRDIPFFHSSGADENWPILVGHGFNRAASRCKENGFSRWRFGGRHLAWILPTSAGWSGLERSSRKRLTPTGWKPVLLEPRRGGDV